MHVDLTMGNWCSVISVASFTAGLMNKYIDMFTTYGSSKTLLLACRLFVRNGVVTSLQQAMPQRQTPLSSLPVCT